MEGEEDRFEEVLKLVGYGKYQKEFGIAFNLIAIAFLTAPYFNMIMVLSIPDHWCNVPGADKTYFSDEEWKQMTIPKDELGNYKKCSMFNVSVLVRNDSYHSQEVDCQHGWTFDEQYYKSTIPSEHSWVCDKKSYVSHVFSCGMLAEVIGCVIFGYLGDRFGRRPVFFAACALLLAGRTLCTFFTDVYALFVVAVCLGHFAQAYVFTPLLIIGMEMTTTEERAKVAFLQQTGWNLSMCVLPLLYWWIGHWRHFMYATTFPMFLIFAAQGSLIESPRWLASRGKKRECARVLKRIADKNGRRFSSGITRIVAKLNQNLEEEVSSGEKIWKSRVLMKTTFFVSITWIVSTCFYQINLLNTPNIGGNPHMNYFYLGIAELPGNILAKFLSDKIGRRLTRFGTFLMATIASFIMIFCVSEKGKVDITIFVSTSIRFAVSMMYYILNLHTAELYPTRLRQAGMSIPTLIAGIVGSLSPYVIEWGSSSNPKLPYIVCTCLGAVGVLAVIPVPETLHQKLPETIKQAEQLGEDQVFWAIPKKPLTDEQQEDYEDSEGGIELAEREHSS